MKFSNLHVAITAVDLLSRGAGTNGFAVHRQHHKAAAATVTRSNRQISSSLFESTVDINDGDEQAAPATAAATTPVEAEIKVEDEKVPEELVKPDPNQLLLASLNEPVPEAGHSVESRETKTGTVHTLTVHLGQPGHPDPLVFETGKIGRQAAGAVLLTRGDSIVYSTCARDDEPKSMIDFAPLSVEYQERFSSAGMTSGGFNKRDGAPQEHEILVSRIIDRPLRPLICDGWKHETQLLNWVMSYDGKRGLEALGATAASAAMYISDVPLMKAVAQVQVGLIDDTFIVNPTNEQMAASRLNLIVAGTKDAVLMIEGAADFLPEQTMIDAVSLGHSVIGTICDGLDAFRAVAGKPKKLDTIPPPIDGLQDAVNALMKERVDASLKLWDFTKKEREVESSPGGLMYVYCIEEMLKEFTEEEHGPGITNAIKAALKKLVSNRMYNQAKTESKRMDGRALDEIRKIDIAAGTLPGVHGSALFTRGESQTIATATLGDKGMRKRMENVEGSGFKRYYLQYSFPPSCIGEVGRVGGVKRREVGHGNLAERAILPALPSENAFPYSLRVESLITESNGSTSMASVCGGCLALMDAGVPIERPVAGIAMGMLLENNEYTTDDDACVVSDILGNEDALGTMDFKVAGDKDGITAFQLDIKCEGLSVQTMERALEQARVGRLHILGEMSKSLDKSRSELPATVPRMVTFSIEESAIGKVIGPGGKTIRGVIEDFGLSNMDVGEEGQVQLTGFSTEKLMEAQEFVKKLAEGGGGRDGPRKDRPKYVGPDAVLGETYTGKITGIQKFGVFVEILPGSEDGSTPGLEGLVHVSELHTERVRNCEAFVGSMNVEELTVKYIGDDKGKIKLSRKAVLEEKKANK
mmetsp:Transcript_33109/g.69678  ORF Transcript_33109/g.69678 Transcript_33109/m.69678 type:complete len:869 (+) Transcript_33109:37-2643(+)